MKFSVILVVLAMAAFATASVDPHHALAQFRERFTALFTKGATDCKFSAGNHEFDFNKHSSTVLKGKDSKNPNYYYTAEFCHNAKETACGAKGGAICQYDKNASPEFVSGLGSFTIEPAPTFSLIESGKPDKGVQIYFENIACTSGLGRKRETTLKLTCGSNSNEFTVTEGSQCIYTITGTSSAACVGGGGSGGLSGGWIFLIILLVSAFLYVAIGCAVCMKKYDKRGLEACPHKSFWVAIPGLTKDGCLFTIGKIKGCFGSKTITTSSGEYESA